ncbi:hypothetical protein L210DRAFT_3554169 [Boletus edulis BED1]|uniref:Uncharacterized protein n=1 Tax=Boletus edulis BED1 TaxID=1328754 RepID=A0AAD4GAS7_BOLED|nr:hypothetical protein L210DRAFT_3554169 [Boletus edulis BED1]
MRLVQIDPPTMMEDITTRSPLQISSPIVPVVIVDTNYFVEAMRQSLAPVGTKELDQVLAPAGDAPGTLNDKGTACETSGITSPQEDRPCWPSPSVEGSNIVWPPAVDCDPSLGTIRTLENTSAPEAARESGTQVFHTSLVEEAAGTNEPRVEVLYEGPRCHADGDLAGSLHNAFRGSDVSVPDATSISKSLKGPDMEGLVNFVAKKESDSMTSILTGQPAGLSSSIEIELPTTKLPEHISALPNTCKEAGPLSITSAEMTSRLGDGKGCEADIMSGEHPSLTISEPPVERTLSGSMHAPPEHLPTPQTERNVDRTPVHDMPQNLTLEEENGGTSMTTETRSKRKQDLYASIHAPQRTSESEAQLSVSQSKDESNCDHRHSVANTMVSKRKPCPPNWTAIPEVVDAFRMFKQAPSENTTRRASSIAECTNRGPVLGIGQKGITTNSLNNISAIANIQNRWMHGNGLLLVRDLVSSDPADFNLRSCTNLRIPRNHGMNAMPVQQILCTRMLDIPPYALQNETIPCPMMSDTGPSSMVVDLPASTKHASSAQRRDRNNACLSMPDCLPGLKEAEIL